jgi:hypothetical protein
VGIHAFTGKKTSKFKPPEQTLRIPWLAIVMFTMPETGVENGMTRCRGLPLTVE